MINFLDVSVILHSDRTIETDIYYKDTNAHDYLPYDSAHPDHSKDNVPYNLAKRIIVFVSNEEKIEYRLNELKNWLKSCKYLENVINRAFRNARLQCSASLKTNSNNIPFVTTYFDNVNNNKKVKKIRRKFNHIQSDHLKSLLKNSNIVLAQKQPKNLLRLLSKAGFNTDSNNFIQLKNCRPGTFTCKFAIHVYHCAMKNKCLKEPYFQLNIMMKLKDSWQSEFYEYHFDKKGFDT